MTELTDPHLPVEECERRVVEIEDIGENGKGIAKVEKEYTLIVPGTELEDIVEVEIKTVRDDYAEAEVILSYNTDLFPL